MEPVTPTTPQVTQPEPVITQPRPDMPPPPPSSKSSRNTIAMLGGAIVILLVGLGAGYLLTSRSSTTPPIVKPSPTPESMQNTPTMVTPTASSNAQLLTYTSTKIPDLSFPAYSIKYPSSWTPEKNNTSVSETYMLNNGDYQIMIYQAPVEGSSCIFAGIMPDHPAQDLRATKYTDLKTAAGVMLRRYPSTTVKPIGTAMDFCSTSNGTDWGAPTQFGSITYKVPVGYSAEKLVEMDNILKTIQEVK